MILASDHERAKSVANVKPFHGGGADDADDLRSVSTDPGARNVPSMEPSIVHLDAEPIPLDSVEKDYWNGAGKTAQNSYDRGTKIGR